MSTSAKGSKSSGFTLLETLIMFGLLFILSMILVALYLHSEKEKESEAADSLVIEEATGDAESTSSSEAPPSEPLD